METFREMVRIVVDSFALCCYLQNCILSVLALTGPPESPPKTEVLLFQLDVCLYLSVEVTL